MNRKWITCTLFALMACSVMAEDKLVFNFDAGDLQGWKVLEGKFDVVVSGRDQFHHNLGKYNKQGTHFLSTLETKSGNPDDSMIGVIESPVIRLTGPKLTMLVGGGKSAETYVALCDAAGKTLLKAHGHNAQVMKPVTWNLEKWVGKPVFLRLYDGSRGGWGHITLDNVVLSGKIDAKRSKARLAKRANILGRKDSTLTVAPSVTQTESLRAAIKDLMATFGKKYPDGKKYLKRLDKIEGARSEDFAALKKEALLANPLVSGQPILYVARDQYPVDHHNTANMFQTGEINTGKYRGRGYLKTVDFSKDGEVKVLLDPGPTSIPRDPELSFDGKIIVFSMRKNIKDNYHIYEINSDGSNLKQLTSAAGVFDIDPLYLADGSIAFTSSRDPKYCMCNRHIMANMFKMEADGANIHQLGRSTLFEGHGSLMPDGRIMYYRWEYVDRNFGDAQGLWVVNPDGSNHAIYWANNTGSPGGVLDGRIIPGTQLCISTFSSCHDRPWGAIAIIDRRKGVDTPDAVVKIWPESARKLCRVKGGFDDFVRIKTKYEDPYPLNKNYFLASKNVKGKMAIVLLDMFGNELVLHQDSQGCFDPMPIAPRKRPKVKPDMRDYKNREGVFYVQNAYIGTHMKGIQPGEIKYLRVVESPPKQNWTQPAWNGPGVHCPGMNWQSFENKRILGTVPVEEDGSAHFECPSDKFIFFQLLDQNKMMLHSMRSGTMIQSGEKQGCVGCHENRVEDAPPMKKHPIALKRKPNKLKGWYGGPRKFSFQKEVQPVFDKHCVKCHDFNKPAGKKLVLAGDRTFSFSASYIDLWRSRFINCVGAGPAEIQQAKSWGSHKSKLIKVMREGHPAPIKDAPGKGDLKLSEEELNRVITWVDLNAPYYPYYESAYPNNFLGRSPLNGNQHNRLRKLTKATFISGHRMNQRAQVSFDRPEMSLCLQKLDKASAEYKEALSIIQAGQAQLKKQPRADMDGFVPCAKDQERLAKYKLREEIELKNRRAILKGKKVYDRDFEVGQ